MKRFEQVLEQVLNIVAGVGIIGLLPSTLWFIWAGGAVAGKLFWSSLACLLLPLLMYKFFIDDEN